MDERSENDVQDMQREVQIWQHAHLLSQNLTKAFSAYYSLCIFRMHTLRRRSLQWQMMCAWSTRNTGDAVCKMRQTDVVNSWMATLQNWMLIIRRLTVWYLAELGMSVLSCEMVNPRPDTGFNVVGYGKCYSGGLLCEWFKGRKNLPTSLFRYLLEELSRSSKRQFTSQLPTFLLQPCLIPIV